MFKIKHMAKDKKDFLLASNGSISTFGKNHFIKLLDARDVETDSFTYPEITEGFSEKLAVAVLEAVHKVALAILSIKNRRTFWYL